MSSFVVQVVQLDAVHVHPNADALELAQIGGYRAVVAKDVHHAGDLVVYVPEASVLPQDVIDAWGFTGKLAGSKKNRVKAIRLRGELSQGLVIPLATALSVIEYRDARAQDAERRFPREDQELVVSLTEDTFSLMDTVAYLVTGGPFDGTPLWLDVDLAAALGIEKYEAPIPIEMAGRQRNRPEWLPMYTDIENIKKYNRSLLDGEEVIFTEKIHGSCFAAGMHKDDLQMLVSSHRCVLEFDENNLYWRAAKQAQFSDHLTALLAATGAESIVLYGEVFGPGVQDLVYGVPAGAIEVRLFDIMVNGQYVDHATFMEMVGAEAEWLGADEEGNSIFKFTSQIPMVPILYRGPWKDGLETLYARGKDTISDSHVREGIVIRPTNERRERFGRLVLKAIGDDYLLRRDGTERN